jgi:hypothetical protein
VALGDTPGCCGEEGRVKRGYLKKRAQHRLGEVLREEE